MKIKSIILSLFLVASTASAEPILGWTALAALSPKFPCAKYVREVSRSPFPGMSVLLGTFGNDTTCIRRFIRKNKERPHALQIYLVNGPCRNNNRCETTEESYLSRLMRFRREVEPLLVPKTRLLLSPFLEDRKPLAWFKERKEELSQAQICPQCAYVGFVRNAVDAKARAPSSWLIEHHGLLLKHTTGRLISNDGRPISLSEVTEFRRGNAGALGIFLWTPDSQGITGTKFIPPSRRSFEISHRSLSLWRKFLRG